jgi:DNA-binding MarR family transcriptional regulator
MTPHPETLQRIRRFNRFYTLLIGLLDQHYLGTPFSLSESRVLYEISQTPDCTAKKIRAALGIDEGYLSRIIHRFLQDGLVEKAPAAADRRLHLIRLTEKGQAEFARLDERSNQLTAQMLAHLSPAEQRELLARMESIQTLLEGNTIATEESE